MSRKRSAITRTFLASAFAIGLTTMRARQPRRGRRPVRRQVQPLPVLRHRRWRLAARGRRQSSRTSSGDGRSQGRRAGVPLQPGRQERRGHPRRKGASRLLRNHSRQSRPAESTRSRSPTSSRRANSHDRRTATPLRAVAEGSPQVDVGSARKAAAACVDPDPIRRCDSSPAVPGRRRYRRGASHRRSPETACGN